jgi:hypothetical protein
MDIQIKQRKTCWKPYKAQVEWNCEQKAGASVTLDKATLTAA